MLWGAGTVDSTDASRLSAFKALTTAPQYIIGFEEPDCSTPGSSNIAVADGGSISLLIYEKILIRNPQLPAFGTQLSLPGRTKVLF